jgi:hypothetical protein
MFRPSGTVKTTICRHSANFRRLFSQTSQGLYWLGTVFVLSPPFCCSTCPQNCNLPGFDELLSCVFTDIQGLYWLSTVYIFLPSMHWPFANVPWTRELPLPWPQCHLNVGHDRVRRARLANSGDKKYPSEYGFFETRGGPRHNLAGEQDVAHHLFVAQRDHGIDARCAAGRNETCQ